MTTDSPAGESETLEERGILPDARWRTLNDRWHAGARLSAEDFGTLLNLALEYHLESARLRAELADRTAERDAAGICELCGGLGYVPTRTPDESGEMYDDCRGCNGSGERPTGAQMEELRDRFEARDCDVQMACEDRRAAEARAARLEEALREIIEWAKYERTGLTARGANRIVATAEDALTEGGGRAEG